MTSFRRIRFLAFISALAMTYAASVAAAETASFEQSYSVDEPIQLDVMTDSGSITIQGDQSGEARVTGYAKPVRKFFKRSSAKTDELLRQFETNPPVEFRGGRLLVGRNLSRDMQRYLTISYEIHVPAATSVTSHTDSGSQTISGISGSVEAGADSGGITLTNISESVKASSDSGSIVADGIAGDFEAHTDSGSIRLVQTAPGDVVVSTDSGSSKLRDIVGAVHVTSDSGSVVVGGQQEGKWILETDSGSVRVDLPADAAFELDARSDSGNVNIDHPLEVQGRIASNRLSGDVRGGGALLHIETDSGSIRIE